MNLYLDARALQKPYWQGEQFYISRMIREMIRLENRDTFHLHFGWDHWNQNIEPLTGFPNVVSHRHRGKFWSHMSLPFAIMASGSKVYYRMYNEDQRMRVPVPCPVAILIHDNGRFLHPQYYGVTDAQALRRDRLRYIHRFPLIFTVSNTVKQELIDLFNLPEQRIVVALNGFDPPNLQDPGQRPDCVPADAPFFLMIGPGAPHKNWRGALAAFDRYIHDQPHDDRTLLVLAGALHLEEKLIHKAIAENPQLTRRVICTNYMTDAQMRYLLQNARICLFPSRYEGFGRPIIEGMAHNVPTIVCDTPISREVAGDAALIVPLDDPQAMADALHRLNTDQSLRAQLICRGKSRVTAYPWAPSAKITLDALTALAGANQTRARNIPA
jgi:glycosyltransferase involved in cell wall biosynthesis